MEGMIIKGKASDIGAHLDALSERFDGWTVEQYVAYIRLKNTVEKQLAEVVK